MSASIGSMLKDWREHRGLSQLILAADADISQKHLSFVESGRSSPSRDMVLKLAEKLEVPLRERNAMLLAAGFAPIFQNRPLEDPALANALAMVERLLQAHAPYPALALDRAWNIVKANDSVHFLLSGVDRRLLEGPANVLRLSLHPRGLAPQIENLAEWRDHLIERIKRQHRITRDPSLGALIEEVAGYAPPERGKTLRKAPQSDGPDIAIPLRLRTPRGVISFLSTVTVFGTPIDVTLSEITLEMFYPLDDVTKVLLSDMGAQQQ